MKILYFFAILGLKIGLWANIFWSNFYWRKRARFVDWLEDSDRRHKNETAENYIKRIARKTLNAFEYRSDGWRELKDSIPPPTEMYARYRDAMNDGTVFSDDCDGFASNLYHLAVKNGVENCAILSIMSVSKDWGHAVLTYTDHGEVFIQDYSVSRKGTYLEEIVDRDYTGTVGSKYVLFKKVYDYDKHKWKHVN